MNTINFILLILALICFIIATFTGGGWPGVTNAPQPSGRFINLVALGLVFWVLASVIVAFKVVVG